MWKADSLLCTNSGGSHLVSLASASPLTRCCQRLTMTKGLVMVRPSWYWGQIKISGPLICSWRPGSRRHLGITKSQHHKTTLPESDWWLSLWRTRRWVINLPFPGYVGWWEGKVSPSELQASNLVIVSNKWMPLLLSLAGGTLLPILGD